jgi:plastocyanin
VRLSSRALAPLLGGLAGLISLTACASDGPDAYSAPVDDAVVTTERVLPSTTLPPPPPESGETLPPSTTIAPVAPNGEVLQVRSLDNSYRLPDVEVSAGTEIWWTNNGRNDHNVLPVNDDEAWGVDTEDFTPGDEYRHVFDTPGVYLYYCSIHGTNTAGMIGSVTVTAASA